ncbi:DUF4352 domain-containing protein [Streptomyces europaeiscabiei]|uniref:hypothetical protein n=1 Tax=Streptomyces europaeiscabiei TaxID=146819 RepID=UPI0038F611F5
MKPSESASLSAPGPVLKVEESGEFETGETDDTGENYKATSKMSVKVVSAEYVTPEEVDTGNEPENGQFVKVTLTLKNGGDAPAEVMTYAGWSGRTATRPVRRPPLWKASATGGAST